YCLSFFFQAEDGIRDDLVTGVQTCALPISGRRALHVARGRTRLDLRAERFAGRSIPDALRAARITGAQFPLFARHRPGSQLVYPDRKSVGVGKEGRSRLLQVNVREYEEINR